MRWFKCTLAYDGAAYCGWQRQANGPSIQEQLELALAKITAQRIAVVGSGRTDAGVHAAGQVASFAAETNLECEVLARALNAGLPLDIRVLSIDRAGEGFNARADARRKWYRYSIHNADVSDVFTRTTRWFVPGALDDAAMHRAAQALVGKHDFASFQTSGSPRASSIRTVFRCDVERGRGGEQEQAVAWNPSPFGREQGEGAADSDVTSATSALTPTLSQKEREQWAPSPLVTIDIEADGFLYNMMRAIVGTLVEVGRGGEGEEWLAKVLAARDRAQAGPTAPAHGLCLMRVSYAE
jgi:tRNA pseudouridine38-40 synthase